MQEVECQPPFRCGSYSRTASARATQPAARLCCPRPRRTACRRSPHRECRPHRSPATKGLNAGPPLGAPTSRGRSFRPERTASCRLPCGPAPPRRPCHQLQSRGNRPKWRRLKQSGAGCFRGKLGIRPGPRPRDPRANRAGRRSGPTRLAVEELRRPPGRYGRTRPAASTIAPRLSDMGRRNRANTGSNRTPLRQDTGPLADSKPASGHRPGRDMTHQMPQMNGSRMLAQ